MTLKRAELFSINDNDETADISLPVLARVSLRPMSHNLIHGAYWLDDRPATARVLRPVRPNPVPAPFTPIDQSASHPPFTIFHEFGQRLRAWASSIRTGK